MPPAVLDETQAASLSTPEGPIPYWVLFDDGYGENFADQDNLTTVNLAVYWDDAATFRTYALGVTEYTPGANTFYRRPPLSCAWAPDQYLISLRKVGIHAGPKTEGGTDYHYRSSEVGNWWTFDDTYARVIYQATFRTLPYDVLTDGFVSGGDPGAEMQRYTTYEYGINPRERKVPSVGFSIYDAGNPSNLANPPCVPIPEVGFVPFYDFEYPITWHRIPWEAVPWTAIQDCLGKVNDAAWDYGRTVEEDGSLSFTRGVLEAGTVLFAGLSSRLKPYRDGAGRLLTDIPFLFKYQPNGWNYVPRNNGTWAPVRVRDSNPPQPLYPSANLWTLFVPEPA